MSQNPDGPLKVLLVRFADRQARLHVQRWKRDHPITVALTLDEMAELRQAIDLALSEAAAVPASTGPISHLDVLSMVRLSRGEAVA